MTIRKAPIFVPYTYWHEPTWAAIEAITEAEGGGRGWHPVTLSPDNDADYLNYFSYRWLLCTDFINVEHDVLPEACQIDALDACPADWCAFNEYDGGPPTLSLARFRTGFIARHPFIWDDLRAAHRKTVFQPLWTKLDSWLTDTAGEAPCVHTTPHVVNVRPREALH